ncbi:hypothetical protein Fmac_022967 [Flemingia macrophylla]|uniref:Uncharacterized protein n=1 Tax=Flemingia macrophylla TaxID=520843 RepID=A0ABD1LK61_9FABA
MVLSNKKLKLKLRAELNQSNPNAAVAEAPSSSNSFKTLLPATRLSKREKRRKLRSSQNPSPPQEPNHETHEEGSNNRKRKRNNKVEGDDVENVVPNKSQNNSKKKKQKQKNKNKKKKKKSKTEEQNGSNGEGETPLPEATELTNTTTGQDNGGASGTTNTKVYVGGIPYYSTEDDIRSYFQSCGTMTEIDCMTFPETGKFRGIALISFKTEAAAKRALALDGADMGGLFLKIQPYKAARASKTSDFSPEILEGYNRIYVGNLSWDITEEELRNFFKKCDIASIRFGMDKETGEFRGYAHVDFSDSQSLKTALTLDQNVLFGRPARISCAVPLKKKPGTHTSSVSTVNGIEGNVNGVDGDKSSSTISGKMRRRTCYECGEKGHGFSECPKKQAVAATAT